MKGGTDCGDSSMTVPTCQDCLKLLLDYLDGELPAVMREKLEAHFGDCPPCEDFLESYRATPALCRKAMVRSIPEAVTHRLTEFLRREINDPSK